MYQGYLAFGGQEVLNAERTAVYVANGHGPDGLTVDACVGDCEDFHQAIADQPYTSPIIDQPPWFDASNPDSYDFAGLVPLDITGADGSTRTREVVARLSDGGIPARGRADPRTIAVSALAIARSECGLSAGISWLTAALHPPCVTQNLCGGAELDGFSCCPAPFCPTQDPDAPLAEIDHSGEEFFPIGGTWDPDTDSFVVSATGGQETNLALNPNMDAAAKAAPVLLATNLVPNPGFGANTTGWTAAVGTLIRQTSNPDVGTGHAQVSATGAGASLSHAAVPVVAGRTYRAVARVRAGNAGAEGDTVTLRLTYRNASNATTGTVTGVAVAPIQTVYKDMNVQGPAPAATTNVVVSLNAASASGDIYWFDSIALFDTTQWPAGFFDGDTPDTADLTFAWTGTAQNSTSTVTGPPVAATNLVPNPGFEVDLTGWVATDQAPPTGAAPPYPGEVLADSPAVYWRLGEASGTAAADASGNARNGVIVGSVTYGAPGLLTDNPDTALTFPGTGTGQFVRSNWASWQNTPTLTVEAWIKTTATGTRAIWDRDRTGFRVFQFRLNNGKLEFIRLTTASGAATIITAASVKTVNDGLRHHVAATYDGSVIRLYIDGVLAQTTVATGGILQPGSGKGLVVGAQGVPDGATTGAAPFQGTIDEAAFYRTALSGARLAAHYAAGIAAPSGPPGFVRTTEAKDTGEASCKYTSAGGAGVGAVTYQYVFGITPGRTYRLSSRLMQPVVGAALRAKVVWHGESGALGTMESEERVLIPGQWTPLSVTGVAPAGATRAVVHAFEDTQQAMQDGDVVYVDSVLFTGDNLGGYFDGDSGEGFGWTGTQGLSPSVAFRMTPTGWHSNDIVGTQSIGVVSQTSERYVTPADGDNLLVVGSTKSLRLDCPGVAVKDCGVYYEITGLDAETLYTLSGWVYVPAGSPDVLLEAAFITQGEAIITKDRWVYRAVAFQTGVGVTNAFIGARTATGGAGTTAGQHFFLDAVMLTQTPAPGNADFDNPNWGPANTEFENGHADGWEGNVAFDTMVVPDTIEASTAHAKYESSSLRVAWPDPAPATTLSGAYTTLNGLQPDGLYTFSAWVYVPSGSPDVTLDFLFLAASAPVTVKDEWVYVTLTARIPPGETTLFAGVQTQGTALGTEVFIDGARFSRGEQALSYFDGDSLGGFWLGEQEQSGSVWAGPGGGTGIIAGPPYTCVDRFTATWTVTPFTGHPVTVRPMALNASGSEVLERGLPVRVEGPGPTTVIWTARQGTWDAWRPALEVEAPGADVVLHTEESVELTLEECIAPLRRSYRNVVTTSGPTVTERIATKDGETTLARLEWTWVAADPFQYGTPELLAQLVPSGAGDPTFINEAVQLSPPTPIGALTCPRPAPVLVSCADDPCAPGFIVPPVPPSIPDTSFPQPAGYNRRAFQIPPELVPSGLGVLTFVAHNDGSDKVGIRVRIWEDPDPDFGNVVECDFLYEFTVGYLAPNESLRIDGPDGTITATCASAVGDQPAERTVRGAYGGPFTPMVVGCTNRYHVAVDVPTTYPTTCDPPPVGNPFYTAGQPQGDLTWTFMLNRRDG